MSQILIHKHDCNTCVFVMRTFDPKGKVGRKVDWYICLAKGYSIEDLKLSSHDAVIGRYGSEPDQYYSPWHSPSADTPMQDFVEQAINKYVEMEQST